jgi:ornithine--oxo-acid transaminase
MFGAWTFDMGGSSAANYTKKITALAEKHLAKNYDRVLNRVFVSAEGSWVYDSKGRRYLDFLSCYSALNVGHAHPKVHKALLDQAERGLWAMPQKFVVPSPALCAQKICRLTGMDRVVWKVSGAEGVEAAMKIARKWGYVKKGIQADKAELIFCENNFHGRTLGVLASSTEKKYQEKSGPHLPGIKTIPFDNPLALDRAITKNTAAFVVEPIQGEGGVIVPHESYLKAVSGICRTADILFIADEVQTGFGRTGRMFASDRSGAGPDMIVVAKAIAGGIPLSAVAGNERSMCVVEDKDEGSTFGGNPLACAVAIATMEVIVEEKLPQKASVDGAYLGERLKLIAAYSSYIKEVRGKGMLWGIELKEDAPDAKVFMKTLLDLGVIISDTKPNVIRIAPPLIITREELEFGLETLRKVFVGSFLNDV